MTENKSLNMHLNIRCSSAESQFLQADVDFDETQQAELRMADDIKKESSVSPRVSELRPGWSAKRNAAENEGSGIVGELLLAVLAFLPDEGNSFELPESEP